MSKSRMDSKRSSKSQHGSTLSKAQSDYITVHQTVQTLIQTMAQETEDLRVFSKNLKVDVQDQALYDAESLGSYAYRVDKDTFDEYERTLRDITQKAKEVREKLKAKREEVDKKHRELKYHLMKWEQDAKTANDEELGQLAARMSDEYAKYTGLRLGN
ncbi:uncharacterized protein FOMMEDRAFT_29513 [Fomitiporia mediterranea MF3/22]|uniref:uncharacterized protein n=1 Tax=Fomitiporia mediterranea (strain MF3/22) TaxID=694068 RepID=UPI0004409439|nr:uncharacterized protein FOMMEDRAFT_29513 [Fomitiporia mediterranea MF3/22]EJD02511.1 hypothetical protein FOMMEDRAFT_29513 [Fomitiporia mediterranea MF3/22]